MDNLYCDTCGAMTAPEDPGEVDFDLDPMCSVCAEHYHCQECGYDVDYDAVCQRPEGCSSVSPIPFVPVPR